VTACPVLHCGATETDLSINRVCSTYGHGTDTRCVINWATIDPEDAGTYTEHLANEATRKGSDLPG
jgi:hypothetical protein